ncbi:MAG: hypothetical protein Q8P50_10630 [Bacillota bacterium]|nr:hypothetical protein [Bacillota bacterium]
MKARSRWAVALGFASNITLLLGVVFAMVALPFMALPSRSGDKMTFLVVMLVGLTTLAFVIAIVVALGMAKDWQDAEIHLNSASREVLATQLDTVARRLEFHLVSGTSDYREYRPGRWTRFPWPAAIRVDASSALARIFLPMKYRAQFEQEYERVSHVQIPVPSVRDQVAPPRATETTARQMPGSQPQLLVDVAHDGLSRDMLPAIRQMAVSSRVRAATRSLAMWGVINLGVWMFANRGGVPPVGQFVGRRGSSAVLVVLMLYGGLVMGLALLAFAAVGSLKRNATAVLLDGVALVAIGLWNILGSGLSGGFFRVIWIGLGLTQIASGIMQFSHFRTVSSWGAPAPAVGDASEVLKKLHGIVSSAEGPLPGPIIKGRVAKEEAYLGLQTRHRAEHWSGQLLEDCAILFSQDISDYTCIARSPDAVTSHGIDFGGRGTVLDGSRVPVNLSAMSMLAVRQWLGESPTVDDIRRLQADGKATRPILEPYIESSDEAVRTAAVEALAAAEKTGAR